MLKSKKIYITNLYIWIFVLCFLNLPAEAWLKLSLFRPVKEFVTNNKELVIEGMVEISKPQKIAVSFNAPAGISDLGSLEESLYSLTTDLGSSYSLVSLVFSPVFYERLSLAPRLVNLSFSENGRDFDNKGLFPCSSGMGQDNGLAVINFNTTIKARYVKIDMLEGWQLGQISVHEVRFIDPGGKILKSKIRGLALELDTHEDGKAFFLIKILLLDGENNIYILARGVDLEENLEENSTFIKVNYLQSVTVEKEPLTISDGYKAELFVPTGALSPQIKKLIIQPLNVKDIDWVSYAENMQIAKGTWPVVAYNIEASVSTPFPVTAKASLKRQQPELAVDSNPNYPSTWMTTVSPLPIWFKIDLRESRPVGKVIITSRLDGNISYGPERLSITLSDDDNNYVEVGRKDKCDPKKNEILLVPNSIGRYVQIIVEEGKQGNNIQINEIELIDEEGIKLLSYMPLKSIMLARPIEMTILYDNFDLSAANIQREENLAIFTWNQGMKEWNLIGGKVDTDNNWIVVNLNHLSTFAIFEAVPKLDKVRWSYNPFSPNNDGIADVTTLSVNIRDKTNQQAKVEIFDHNGKLIRTLIHEEGISGNISIKWDGKDENGRLVSIGPYLYQITVGNEIRNGVLVVAK